MSLFPSPNPGADLGEFWYARAIRGRNSAQFSEPASLPPRYSDCPSDVSAAERTDSVERRGRATGDGVSGRELRSSIDAEAAANR